VSAPDLSFRVEGAEVLTYAAVPTLLFRLEIENRSGEPVRSIMLNTQIRIAPAARSYSAADEARLSEVFGPAPGWGRTLKSMLWTHTVLLVPPFTGSTVAEMPVPCSYDLEVTSARYFHALEEGEIPLELLFSGTLFYAGEVGLQAAQIPWDREAWFRLPVGLWKEMMEHYFPNSAWLRIRRDLVDRLDRFRAGQSPPTWDAALEELLRGAEERSR